MSIVTLSPKFQVVIPQRIRESLGLKPGQKVEAIQYLDRVELIPVRSPRAMRGSLKGINTTVPRDKDRVLPLIHCTTPDDDDGAWPELLRICT
jgi:AbrB family looped-hinge helix DNA binding protein